MQIKYYFLIYLLSSCCLAVKTNAQPNMNKDAAEIKLALQKMQVLGNVLYIAAHPDDENTRLITYFAKGKGFSTTYLSLTRGDGGQNLVGKEVREQLGVIRTQELLAARRIDGGQQAFSRANDFGYSKTAQETFTIWNKEKVLADAVWVIRTHRPDIIVTRFSPPRKGMKTHGHHTASAIIAVEAFKAAANKNRFPEQLKYTDVWQAKRVLWNTSWWFYGRKDFDKSGLIIVDAGAYSPLLGKNYGELAATSRSKHKSQGFGSALQRGTQEEYFQHLVGERATNGLFEGIDYSWERVSGGKKVADLLKKANQNFDITNPAASIPALITIHTALDKMPEGFWVNKKKKELEEIIWQCAGLWADANHKDYSIAPNDSLHLTVRLIKRSKTKINLHCIGFTEDHTHIDSVLSDNVLNTFEQSIILPKTMEPSQPYWLTEKEDKGMFKVKNQTLIGLPENPAAWQVMIALDIGTQEVIRLEKKIPVSYRWTDPVAGERYRPLEIRPAVTVNIENTVYLFANEKVRKLNILTKAHRQNVQAKLNFQVPKGWKVLPKTLDLSFKNKYDEQKFTLTVTPPKSQSVGVLKTTVEIQGKQYSYALNTIEYPHIPIQSLFPPSESKLVKLNIKTEGKHIGYIMGAGDAIPEALGEIGYQVDILSDEQINSQILMGYDAVIVGVRAYNTNKRMKYHQKVLMEYVKQGGNMIVQYNTNRRLVTKDLGPYPIKLSRDRITVEESPVKILTPNHPLLNKPNKITNKDFEGWVQERGLYFPNEWDERYQTIISCHDPNEEEKSGGLLATTYGKGTFIYTGYSWFRELPAGVPGAYRLFANMIAFKQ